MRLLLRILRWILIALVLLLLVGGGGGYLWLRGALPQTTGTIQVPGIGAPIEIIRDGLADMSKAQGSDDLKNWRWDRVHHAIFPHNVFDGIGAFKPIFSRSIPNGGDAFTIDVAPVDRSMPYHQSHVPSYREIIDLSDLGASRFMHTVGQSGQVVSGDYSNLIERWVKIQYLPMRYAKDAIDRAANARLVLEPR